MSLFIEGNQVEYGMTWELPRHAHISHSISALLAGICWAATSFLKFYTKNQLVLSIWYFWGVMYKKSFLICRDWEVFSKWVRIQCFVPLLERTGVGLWASSWSGSLQTKDPLKKWECYCWSQLLLSMLWFLMCIDRWHYMHRTRFFAFQHSTCENN